MPDLTLFDIEAAGRFPQEVARHLESATLAECAAYLERLPAQTAARVGANMSNARWAALLQEDRVEVGPMLEEALIGDAIALLNRLSSADREIAVSQIEDEARQQDLRRFLQYPPHCVGAIVKNPTGLFHAGATRANVVAALRQQPSVRIPTVVIIDESARYAGVLDPWRLLMHCPEDGVVEHYLDRMPGLRPERAQEDALDLPAWRTNLWLPVVDREQRVLGVCWRSDLAGTEERGAREENRLSDTVFESLGELTDIVFRSRS